MGNSYYVHKDIDNILYSEEQIAARIRELGRKLAVDYADKEPLILGTMLGAFMFTADLARAMHPVPEGLQVDFIRASSYGAGTQSSGNVKVINQSKADVAGRHVLLIEDIVDTGHTAKVLRELLLQDGAASVAMVSLLSKPSRRKVEVPIEYVGFECPDEFVVGYGLDFNEDYRSLPYIGVLKPECYST